MDIKKIISAAVSFGLALGVMPMTVNAKEEKPETVKKEDFIYLKYSDYASVWSLSKLREDLEANIEIPDMIEGVPVTEIYGRLFADHDEIVSVKLPDTITYIGESAFGGCSNLSSINVPRDLSETGRDVFSGCRSLKSISIPAGMKTINGGMLCYSGIKSVKIADGVEEIASSAFIGCSELTSIDLPSSVNNISYLAFDGCLNLRSIAIANPDCEIYDHMFTISTFDKSKFHGMLHEMTKYIEDNKIKVFEGTIYGYKDSTAQAYAEKYGYDFVGYSLGDINGDININALDASLVLTEYAAAATGGNSTFNVVQKGAADVNKDGAIDALDASLILSYYAFTATGGTESLAEFLNK